MDGGIVDPDELLVEQRAQEARSDVVHGHAAAELVEGWHDDRLFREFRIPLVFPQKRDPHPTRDDLSVTHRISERGRGMIVSHDEDLRLHDFLVRPCVAVTEAGVVEAESVGGLEPDVAGHDVFQHPVMVPLRDVDLPEHGREVSEEHVHIPPLAGCHLRDEMLHITKDDDAARTAAGCNLGEFPSHHLRPARNVDALFPQFLLESDMEVSDYERIVRHEDGLVRDWFEVHGRSKGGVRLIIVWTGDSVESDRNFARTRPSWSATSAEVRP